MTSLTPPQTRGLNRRHFLQITAATTAVAALYAAGRRLPRGLRVTTLSETRTLMGTAISLAVVSGDAEAARRAVAATFAEMERLIALFDHRRPQSPLAELNRTGELAAPPSELHALLERAQRYSVLTGGAFDISVKPLLDAARAGAADAAAYRRLVDYRRIEVQPHRIGLGRGMALTLDGIAKGRVVDGATAVLQAAGFPNILVEAGGDLMGLGARADGRPWRVGVSHPRQAQAGLVRLFPLSMQAVATSGDYMHHFSQDFRRHHILDPRSGLSPAGLASATVIAPSATDADALSTALLVLGSEAGLALVERLPHVEALLISKELEVRQSAGFPAGLTESSEP